MSTECACVCLFSLGCCSSLGAPAKGPQQRPASQRRRPHHYEKHDHDDAGHHLDERDHHVQHGGDHVDSRHVRPDGSDGRPGKTYAAELSGRDVVPAVDTAATGSATFMVDATGTRMNFVLSVSNITDVIASRVHVGKAGSNSPGVLILYPGPTISGAFTGNVSGGTFTASVLFGQLTGKTIADFVALITSGQAYVNVGTTENPGGEIRGQIH